MSSQQRSLQGVLKSVGLLLQTRCGRRKSGIHSGEIKLKVASLLKVVQRERFQLDQLFALLRLAHSKLPVLVVQQLHFLFQGDDLAHLTVTAAPGGIAVARTLPLQLQLVVVATTLGLRARRTRVRGAASSRELAGINGLRVNGAVPCDFRRRRAGGSGRDRSGCRPPLASDGRIGDSGMKVRNARTSHGAVEKHRGRWQVVARSALTGSHTRQGLRAINRKRMRVILRGDLVLREDVDSRGHAGLVGWIAEGGGEG